MIISARSGAFGYSGLRLVAMLQGVGFELFFSGGEAADCHALSAPELRYSYESYPMLIPSMLCNHNNHSHHSRILSDLAAESSWDEFILFEL